MTTPYDDTEVLEREVPAQLPQLGGAAVDVQVATARRFPRSITTFIRRATEMATLTPEIAASCVYALPRGGKSIEGPSARLAEIVASAWGNLRIQAGATDNDDKYITARGEAWDVESNVAIGFEVRRRITNQRGETYNDDMITVTGNAAASIALRNAVFKVVPSSFWKPIYQKCRQVIAGDARTFASRRDEMVKAFGVMGVTPERLVIALGLKGVADITLDHMVTLTGVYNALKDGETTIEEAFPESGGLGTLPQAAPRKSAQPAPQNGGSEASTTGPTSTPESSPAPASVPPGPNVGVIVRVDEREAGTLIQLDNGFQCATATAAFITAAKNLSASRRRVELTTRAAKAVGKLPILTEIDVVTEN